MSYQHVLAPIQIGPMRLKNRVSFTPVWPSFATADGHVNRALMEWVRTLAKGGAACVNIGCGTVNHGLPREVSHLLRMGEESVVNELTMLCDLAHMYRCKLGMELFAISMSTESFETRDAHGDDVAVEINPNTLTKDQIHEFIADFAEAAERSLRCGFDNLVIHGAHGQLPGCFLSKRINRRTDEYGAQNMENRVRFTKELLQAIRAKVGRNIAIEYRINASDMIDGSPSLDEVIAFVKEIEPEIDLLHVSRGMHSMQTLAPYINQPLYYPHGINLEDAAAIKAAVSVPVSAVGSVTLDQAEAAIAAGKLDMVSMARGLIADPEQVNKARYGCPEKTRPCIRCNQCINRTHYFLAPIQCSVNAEIGLETLYQGIPAPAKKKKVAIIGGGPAGLEAARTAADRGHSIVLFEKSDRLGGVLNLAAGPAFKEDIRRYLEWSVRSAQENPAIEIRMQSEPDPETLKREDYDAVIVAVGSAPIIPKFVSESENVVWVGQVESGEVEPGKNVLIVGAGLTGCEAALKLARKGHAVTLADMVPEERFGSGGAKFNQIALIGLLKDAGVIFLGGVTLTGIDEDKASFKDEAGEELSVRCDTAVLSLGMRPREAEAERFEGCAPDVIAIGDCMTRQGTLFNAVHTGHEAACLL